MPPQRVLEIETDVDLALFSAYLWQQKVAHRIYEEQGRQVLEVQHAEHADPVLAAYRAWRSGALQLARAPGADGPTRRVDIAALVRRYPVLVAFLGLVVLCYPATWAGGASGFPVWASWLTFLPVLSADGQLVLGDLGDVLAAGQFWRLLTPVFLHFSVPHLLFNVAVVAEFGRRIERGAGGITLLIALLVIGVTSNLAQYAWSGPGIFGGASGVAYGLVGFVVARGRIQPEERAWHVNRSFVVAVIVFLVIMSSGVTELFGLHIANAAHWAGLIVGALLGALRRGPASPEAPKGG